MTLLAARLYTAGARDVSSATILPPASADAARTPEPSEAGAATRGSAIKLTAEVTGRLLSLVTTLVVARRLGVAEFGTFAALSGAAVLVAELADLGLQATAARALVAHSLSLASMTRAKTMLSGSVLALALAAGFFSPLLAVLIGYFTLAGWSEFLGIALRARGRRAAEAATILCLRGCGLACAWPVLQAGGGTLAVASALAVSTLPAVGLAALLLRGSATAAEPPARAVRPLVREALPLGLNGGLALLSLRLEVMLLGALRGGGGAGPFAAALRFVEPLMLVPSSVAGGAMPELTREALRGSGPVRARTAATAALLAVPAAVGLCAVGGGLVTLLLGEAFRPATRPLRLLTLAIPALFMNGVLLHALIAAGRGAWLPRLTGLRVGAAALLALGLIPPFGVTGAAAGFVVSELVLLALAARACRAAGFAVPVLRPLLLAAAVSAPMAFVLWLVPGPALFRVAVGLAAYALTLAVLWKARVLPA